MLNRLTEHGLVDRVEAGRAFLFVLNRDHLAAPAVVILAGMRDELFSRTRRELETWEIAPLHVSMFGSAARGDGSTQSDIDLFVVRPSAVEEDDSRWRAQLDDLARQIQRWTGNPAGIAEVAETEIPAMQRHPSPIVAELRTDAIVLSGVEITALFGAP